MSTTERSQRVRMCKHLRSKEMFHSETPQEEELYHSGIFWCGITAQGMGPDGTCADSEECSRGRECFED